MATDFTDVGKGDDPHWFLTYIGERLKKYGGKVFGKGSFGQGRKTQFTEGSLTKGTSDFT